MFERCRVAKSALENSLRVVTIELPHLHTATVALFVKAGSRYEAPQDNGLSHFLEHMLYRGTEAYPSSYELNFAFESLGSGLHAETGRDYSLYQTAVVAGNLNPALELFGELIARPRFGDIDLERALILEELSEDYDQDGNELNASDLARSLIFEGHPLSQRIIGPAANVKRFGEDDLRRHFASHYCARNMVLAVAGPIEAKEVERAAASTLGSIPAGETVRVAPPPEPSGAPRFRYVSDPGSQTELQVVWRALPELDRDYPALIALSRTLDDGMAARLHYQLCDQLGLAYSLSAGLEPLHDVTLLEVAGQAANAKVPELLSQLRRVLMELADEPVSARELEKVKRRYRYELACTIDDPGAMVGWYGGTALFYEPPDLDARAAAVDAVSAADIQRAARTVFTPERLTTVAVGSLSRAQQAEAREAIAGGLGKR